MTYPKNVWQQLKGKTVQDIQNALLKDGWVQEITSHGPQAYRHPDRPEGSNRVVLHIHAKATKSPRIMKGLLDQIGWTVDDMIRLKLIKGKGLRKN